jgi:hypothetical protein
MTILSKAFWSTEGNNISFSMPIQKIDKERRVISGWATLDMLDKQGDIVNVDASVSAFKRFRGNIREQHTPLAVGKMLSFKQDKYFDKNNDQVYNGIYVDVYISKGAEDTWHKINEKILTGFSIGGRIIDSEDVYTKGADGPTRVIKEYELDELSIVDNPACPAADIVSIQKFVSNNNEEIEKNYLEGVFWCSKSDMIILSENSDASCPDCSKQMTNIGFIETNEVNKSDIIRNLFETFTKGSDEKSDDEEAIDDIAKSIAQNNEKEGISMAGLRSRNVAAVQEDIVTKSDEVVAEDAVIEEVVEEAAAEEVVEEPVDEPAEELAEEIVEKSDADNVVVEEAIEKSTTPTENNVDLAKSVDEVKASLVEIFGDLSTTIKSLRAEIADLKKSVESANGEINVVKNSVNEVKGNMSEFGQRIDEVEADTAVRKSGDLGGVVQEVKLNKSMWGGRFLSSADLYR